MNEISGEIDFVIDDNPKKVGMFMPNGGIEIVSSRILAKDANQVCLLGLNPNHHNKIRDKHSRFLDAGGQIILSFQKQRTHSWQSKSFGKSLQKFYIARACEFKHRGHYFTQSHRNSNPRNRVRICFHQSPNDELHEMVIVHKNCYVRPHSHRVNRGYSYHRGEADLVLFNSKGVVANVFQLGPLGSSKFFIIKTT